MRLPKNVLASEMFFAYPVRPPAQDVLGRDGRLADHQLPGTVIWHDALSTIDQWILPDQIQLIAELAYAF